MRDRQSTHKTRKPREHGRGESVVRSILDATLEELARAGYGSLRVEDVADRAGVNKTTVYRRWPTKPELVRAALLSISGGELKAPDTGSLRGDLLELAGKMFFIAQSTRGQSITRVLVAEGPDSELLSIARSIHKEYEHLPHTLLQRAVARGELEPEVDGDILLDVLRAAIHHRCFVQHSQVDDAYIAQVVDLLLLGAAPRSLRAVPRRRARRRAASQA